MGHHAQAAGAEYERIVSSACLHYMAEMVATVAKVPTEMRAGKYATASTVDFMGYLSGGLHCAFEVKGSRSPYLDLTRPPRKKGDPRRPTLEAHQLEYLDYAALDGCRAGVLVGVTIGRDTHAEEMLWWWVHPKAWVKMVESAKADPRWKNPRATQGLLTQHGWKCPMIEVSGGGRAPDWLSASAATPCPKLAKIATLEAPARAFRLVEFVLDPISENRVILGAILRDGEDFEFIRSQVTPCVNCIGGEDYFRRYEYLCARLAEDATTKNAKFGPLCQFGDWRPIHDRVKLPAAFVLGLLPRVKPTLEQALERCSTKWRGALDLMARGPAYGPAGCEDDSTVEVERS